ncbi:MAG TPA: 1,4-alpha-glucan branching protein domain-containing protein [Acidobacteriaceae bacterium]|jgi:1,4-alpha-glucan branching enzyme|nr:1,4-alpha-glucan branching protein domain-containing protein [Acidobacteriaceae bacterium]
MTPAKRKKVSGFLSFTLHSHLPYVVNHGTWPHGLEWLLEAAAETYLPLLHVIRNLERDGIALKANINLSPILLEQLAHPVFCAEFPQYVQRKIVSAREDEAYFSQNGEQHFAETARYWEQFFTQALTDFEALGGDIVRGFREAQQAGLIEIITCAATHGYFPLLGTDESILAQVRTGVATHEHHIGRKPRGIWLPECAYRPAGHWNFPVVPQGSDKPWHGYDRIGVEDALGQSGIDFFFVDTHLVEESVMFTPYELRAGGAVGVAAALAVETGMSHRSLYKPYYADGPHAHQHPVAIFPRDPRTGLQVWSGDTGYPGDSYYLDFHKKRWPGGHRYWQVTHAKIDMAFKTPYYPEKAAARTRDHAEHFVTLVYEALKPSFGDAVPPILTAPFDAELFGHWWFEGPMWLEHVARVIARKDVPIALTTASEYLDKYPAAGYLALEEGSWGKNGTNEVWLNPDTRWTWRHIYPAEASVREAAASTQWRGNPLGTRILKQLCRELLLLESSDWQFLITTESARDYAEERFLEHLESFRSTEETWRSFLATGSISEDQDVALAAIEKQDSIFADIDPSLWAPLKS